MELRQIVHTWMYGSVEIERATEGLQRIGVDGADLTVTLNGPTSTPDVLLKKDIRRIMADCNLKVLCVTPLYMSPELDMCHPEKRVRQVVIDFSKKSVDIAAHTGCDRMLVSPSYISVNNRIHRSYAQDWDQALETMRILAEYAAERSVTLMIEPINRYRVSLVHTVGEALRMIGELGISNVGMVPDTFHMNMEDNEGVAGALIEGGKYVKCIHIGDNNRKAPGYGAMDWRAVLETLSQIGFTGPLSHEPMFLYFDENTTARDGSYLNAFEQQLAFGIRYLRCAMESITCRKVVKRQ